jgi:hypothetical protein
VVEDRVEQESLNRERNRRENFRFSLLGIAPGAVLTFVRDESIQAIVIDDRRIRFNGAETSLSSSALEILRSRYGYRAKTIAGPQYWCFEGKSLSEIRQELESGERDG